jgi:hypothetical protein
VGDTLDLHTANGRPFSATLTKVTDPAQGKGQAPKSGKRFVTTAFDIHNTSQDALHADLNADVTVTGTNGHLYTVSSVANSACGGLTTGQFQVPVGKSASVCTGFELKDAVHVTKVQLSPAAGTASDYGEWLNP